MNNLRIEFDRNVAVIADDVIQEMKNTGDLFEGNEADYVHDFVDGIADVIYYSAAWELVSYMRLNCAQIFYEAEMAIALVGADTDRGIDDHMQTLAYYMYYGHVVELVQEKIEELRLAA